jgi:hypothetical protein
MHSCRLAWMYVFCAYARAGQGPVGAPDRLMIWCHFKPIFLGGLLGTRQRTFGFHKMRRICGLAEQVSPSQKGICFMRLVKLVC